MNGESEACEEGIALCVCVCVCVCVFDVWSTLYGLVYIETLTSSQVAGQL